MLRRTGITAVLVSISAGITSTVLFAAVYQFRPDLQEPTRLVAAGATSR